jgi:decaprenylphospho-beta-D-ribofuranose 2-oxidase
MTTTVLTGWGRNVRSSCVFTQLETPGAVRAHLDPQGARGTIARGLGRSYGDPALNTGGRVLGLARLDRYLGFDEATGRLTCEAGVSLAQIIEDFAPRGWFPLVTPGTKYVTVGGCIANDVHGKAHHAQGSFAASVERMSVLLASGEVVEASRQERPELFWATFGGMGLLGIVLEATIRLRHIETTYFHQKAVRAPDLEAILLALDEHDAQFPYSMATLDVTARGARLGTGVLSLGEHVRLGELPPALQRDPLTLSAIPRLTVPFELPTFTLNPLTSRLLNALILEKQARLGSIGHYEGFVYPLDFLHHWNRGYGRRGFTQYQFVVPFDRGLSCMRAVLEAIVASGQPPLLNVLKRLGQESGGLLSFPREGYTLAIDFPIRPGTEALLRSLDALVLEAGGRVYLGKDSFLSPETFRAMYPRHEAWSQIKAKLDPEQAFASDLGRRIGLVG